MPKPPEPLRENGGNTAIEQEALDLHGAIQRHERGAMAVEPPSGEDVTALVQDYKG
jgi:hypothetical protein